MSSRQICKVLVPFYADLYGIFLWLLTPSTVDNLMITLMSWKIQELLPSIYFTGTINNEQMIIKLEGDSLCYTVCTGMKNIMAGVISICLSPCKSDLQFYSPSNRSVSSSSISQWANTMGTQENMNYRQVSSIRCTISQHLKDSRTVLRLSLWNPLKPDVKSRMKM